MILFHLINRFILWLNKILPVHQKVKYKKETVEVTLQSEEKSSEVLLKEEKPAKTSLPEKKTTEVSPPAEGRPPVIPFKEEPVEVSYPQENPPEIPFETLEKVTEPQAKYSTEEPKTEEKTIQKTETDIPKPPKPYKKKPPTEESKDEPSTVKRKLSSHEQRKTIHLGDTQRRRRSLTGTQRKPASDENIEKETADKLPGEKEFAHTIESPYVEINLDNGEVYLILPKQQFKANTVDEILQQTSYSIDLNGKQQKVLVRITNNRDGLMFVEEKRILLEAPLLKFKVAFPDETQGGEYNYNHNDKGLYAFVAIGNNRGRMYYLFAKDGKSNSLPKRVIWVLLHEEFMLQTILGPSDITDERWIWDKYKPFRIDLREIGALVIKNRGSGEEKSFSLQSTFCVEGEQLVEDDFKKECPLFTGKILNIEAPYENQSGWNVWILHKSVGAQKVFKNWTGKEPISLNCPEDLPCDCGEFQIDICQQGTRIPDETLFFRWMPCIELNYPKELIVPDPKLGHIPSTISVKFDSDDEWELKHKEGREFKLGRSNNIYEIELLTEEDTLRFSILKTTRLESICNFQITLPRLKWKTSKQKAWNSRLQKIERKDLKTGESLYLLIKTNDFSNQYSLLALLETNGQKLQEGKFIPKGMEYSLDLNQFFDTIKHNEDRSTIRVEIRKVKDSELLGAVETLFFEGETKVPITIPVPEPRVKTTFKISNIQALVKCQGRTSKQRNAKGFSKRELNCAGINLRGVRCLNIPYDRRRKSSHHCNIVTLKTLKGKYDNYGGR